MTLARSALLILAVAICLAGSDAGRVRTVKGDLVCVCTMDYRPVCDTTGYSYPNLCSFECARDEALELGRAAITLRGTDGTCL